MKIYSQPNISGAFVADIKINVRDPDSGFRFSLGQNTGVDFDTGLSFYGYSGYVFDQENVFFGGYSSGSDFGIQVHVFEDNRVSYFFEETLIRNNLTAPFSMNTFEFEKIGDSSAFVSVDYTRY